MKHPLKFITLDKGMFYLVTVAGFFGTTFLLIDLGLFSLFPYRILFLSLLFFFLMQMFLRGKLVLPQIKVRWYLGFLGIWLFYALLTGVWVASQEDFVRHISFLFLGIAYIFFCVYYLRSLEDFNLFYYLWLLIICVLTPIGLWETVTGNHLSPSRYFSTAGIRFIPTAVFYNPNDYATFISISLPFLMSFLHYERGIFRLIFASLLFLANLYLLLLTGSRSNFLAVIVECLFFLFILSFKDKIKIPLLFIGVLFLFLLFYQGSINNAWIQGVEDFVSLSDSRTTAGRINHIKDGFSFLLETMGFGVGAGNAEYWKEWRGSGQANRRGVVILNLHNWWLEILVNYGVFIFVGYVCFYVSLIWNLLKAYNNLNRQTDKRFGEALLIALLGFSIACFSSSSLMGFNPQWFMFGYAVAFLNYSRLKRHDTPG